MAPAFPGDRVSIAARIRAAPQARPLQARAFGVSAIRHSIFLGERLSHLIQYRSLTGASALIRRCGILLDAHVAGTVTVTDGDSGRRPGDIHRSWIRFMLRLWNGSGHGKPIYGVYVRL